jgi:hypothetical protein
MVNRRGPRLVNFISASVMIITVRQARPLIPTVRRPGKQPSDQPVVASVHDTLFVCVIFMRKKSAVVKSVPKDFVAIVFLGIPMPTVRPPCKPKK